MVAKRPQRPIIPKGQPPAARNNPSQEGPSKGVQKKQNREHHHATPPASQRGSAVQPKHLSAQAKVRNGFAGNAVTRGDTDVERNGVKPASAAPRFKGKGQSLSVNGSGSACGGSKQQPLQRTQLQPEKMSQHKQVSTAQQGVTAPARAAAAATAGVAVTVPLGAGSDAQPDLPVKKKKWHPKKRPRDPAAEPPAAPAAVTKAQPKTPKKKHKNNKTKAEGVPGVTTSTALPEPGAGVVVGSNWLALKKVINASTGPGKRRPAPSQELRKLPSSVGDNTGPTQVVAMDCEMVGVGPDGKRSALARVCVVNNDGNVLLDTFVCPKEAVTDYRTQYSGVRAADLASPQAITMLEAQMRVAELMKHRIVVGHALQNDMKALMLTHPAKDIRDTAKYPPLMLSTAPGRKPRARALRHLALEVLGLTIQGGEHSPVDDARCALYLYHRHRKAWEQAIRSGKLARTVEALGKRKRAPKVDIYKRDVRDDPLADL